jgi:hypothetical protein
MVHLVKPKMGHVLGIDNDERKPPALGDDPTLIEPIAA